MNKIIEIIMNIDRTKPGLYKIAGSLSIKGRSKMNKSQLKESILKILETSWKYNDEFNLLMDDDFVIGICKKGEKTEMDQYIERYQYEEINKDDLKTQLNTNIEEYLFNINYINIVSSLLGDKVIYKLDKNKIESVLQIQCDNLQGFVAPRYI